MIDESKCLIMTYVFLDFVNLKPSKFDAGKSFLTFLAIFTLFNFINTLFLVLND